MPTKGGVDMCKRNKDVVEADHLTGGNTMAGLIIFILIILQFKKRGNCSHNGQNQIFDNSTLFILVLYVVACCGKVKLGC